MRALLLAAALLLPALARAQAAAPAGLVPWPPSLSLRVGYAPAFGSAADSLPMSQVVRGQVPIQADALVRYGPLAAGAYASWGPGIAGGCDPGARCSASSLRLGLEATWTFRAAPFAPWGGLGAGYEWTTRRRAGRGGDVEWSYRGWEVLSVQGGADLVRRGPAAFGPFVLVALGRYSRLALDTPAGSGSGEIAGKRFHAWIEAGVRAKLDL